MRGIKLLAVVGLVVALAVLGMVTANAQQSCVIQRVHIGSGF